MILDRAIALAVEIDQRTYYEILGVRPDCSFEEVDQRYYHLAPRLHPDRFARRASPDELRALTRISARLTEARNVLSAPKQRALYDEGLARGELRLKEEEGTAIGEKRDPKTPVARRLYNVAIELAVAGKAKQAVAKLRLALGFEADSVVINEAIAKLVASDPQLAAIAENEAEQDAGPPGMPAGSGNHPAISGHHRAIAEGSESETAAVSGQHSAVPIAGSISQEHAAVSGSHEPVSPDPSSGHHAAVIVPWGAGPAAPDSKRRRAQPSAAPSPAAAAPAQSASTARPAAPAARSRPSKPPLPSRPPLPARPPRAATVPPAPRPPARAPRAATAPPAPRPPARAPRAATAPPDRPPRAARGARAATAPPALPARPPGASSRKLPALPSLEIPGAAQETAPPPARRHDRIPLSTKVSVEYRDWEGFESSFTRNLSLGGVFLKMSRPLPIGSAIALTFALPDGSSLEIPGRVARRVEASKDTEGGVGIQFLEMPAATKRHIETLLAGPSRRAASEAEAEAEADDNEAPGELTLESVVSELLQARERPPQVALGLPTTDALTKEMIERAYIERSAPLGKSMLTTGDPNLIAAITELAAHLTFARDRLLEELSAESDKPALIEDAPPAAEPERKESSVVVEFRTVQEREPRDAPPPLMSRPVLATESLADLAPHGVAASEDSELADRIFELIAGGHYEAAVELIAKLVPDEAPKRLIAARHIARGYLAEKNGDMKRARVEFETALKIDRTSCEAIIQLRKAPPS